MRVARILGTLEPGGAQLFALRLSAELRRHGVATTLLAGDATPSGLELAARYGLPADAYRVSDVLAGQPAVDARAGLRRLARPPARRGRPCARPHDGRVVGRGPRCAAARAAGGQRAQPDVLARRRPHAAGAGGSTAGRHVLRTWADGPRVGGGDRPGRRPAAPGPLAGGRPVGQAAAGAPLAAANLRRPVPQRQGTRDPGGSARTFGRAAAGLPGR